MTSVVVGGKADMPYWARMSAFETAGSTGRRNTLFRRGKMECMTICRGHFRGFNCGRENGDFGIAGSVRKTFGFKPQQKE
jgi:hypothetical protein